MSRSRPQTITGQISFGNMNVQRHVNISALNNVPLKNFKKQGLPNFSSYQDLEKLLYSGGFAVDGKSLSLPLLSFCPNCFLSKCAFLSELFIEGNIHTTNGVNFLNLSMIAQNAVKLTGGNTFLGSLFFEVSLLI